MESTKGPVCSNLHNPTEPGDTSIRKATFLLPSKVLCGTYKLTEPSITETSLRMGIGKP